jgi:hypothetical protein
MFWWLIPLVIVLLPAVLIAVWALSMRRNMPWQNIVAVTSNLKIKISPALRKYALSGDRDYSTLPDPLIMEDGTAVQTQEQFEQRRSEILSLFSHYVYGMLPKAGFTTSFEVVEQGDALEGNAVRKQVKITTSTSKGASDALMLLYLPKQAKKCPVIVGLNFRGNHTVLDDPAIIPSYTIDTSDEKWEEKRGSAAARWNIVESISRGYAVACIHSADLAPDKKDQYNSRVVALFDDAEFKAVGAWAFGILRGVDYLLQEDAISHDHIAVVGHSRLGKAALWAAANDTRIGMVLSNDAGNTGSSLSRGNHGETVCTINMGMPHWFCSNYYAFGKNENALPVDQNLLLAAIAPRKLYIGNAEDDLWADPQGSFNALQSAKKAFALYYDEVLPDELQTYPEVNTAFFCQSMGIHLRSGWHDIQAADWKFYLDYMDRYFIAKETENA